MPPIKCNIPSGRSKDEWHQGLVLKSVFQSRFVDCLEDCNCPGGYYWDTIFKECLPDRLMWCQQSIGSSLLLKFFVELCLVVGVCGLIVPRVFYVSTNHLEFFYSIWKQKSVKIGSFVLLLLWMWNTLWDLPWFYNPESLFTLCFIGEYSGMLLYSCPVAERAENKPFLWHLVFRGIVFFVGIILQQFFCPYFDFHSCSETSPSSDDQFFLCLIESCFLSFASNSFIALTCIDYNSRVEIRWGSRSGQELYCIHRALVVVLYL